MTDIPNDKRRDNERGPTEYLGSSRKWIYIVTIVGGLAWGVYFILGVLRSAQR
jgi:hypothetical protein